MSRRLSPTSDAVLAALAGGPKARYELEALLGKALQSTMHELKNQKRIYVHGWLRGTGNMRAMRMVYGLGNFPEAPKPPADRLAKHRRYYKKHRDKIAVKRKLNRERYADKLNAASRRLRAKKKLQTNPFLQLAPEIYRELKRKATKRDSGRKRKAADRTCQVGEGELAGRLDQRHADRTQLLAQPSGSLAQTGDRRGD